MAWRMQQSDIFCVISSESNMHPIQLALKRNMFHVKHTSTCTHTKHAYSSIRN